MGFELRETDHDQVSPASCSTESTNELLRYGVKNIRELLGHKVDLNFVENNPAVRLERD